MGFSDSIFKFTGGICPPTYRITVCGASGIYIEGVIKIVDIKDNIIVLKLNGAILKISGEKLKITSYVEKDISISGDVLEFKKERTK
ncbi:MAG: YabP/YqfC family sporulation protein [Clostridia bacterium]|nr:YabP/YqfC family sporulation protein [Clostridia bacterium]